MRLPSQREIRLQQLRPLPRLRLPGVPRWHRHTHSSFLISHFLEFSDNSGTEWSMRRETPAAAYMQAISARRSVFLQQRGLFSRVCRVSSNDNRWADWLSRQRVREVILEANALGLTVLELTVPPAMRDTHWLRSVVA